jgi:hypothetical protein
MLNPHVKAHQKMTQRPIVAYLLLKEMPARAVYDDIIAILGPDAFDDADQILAAVEVVLESIGKGPFKRSFSIEWTDYGNESLPMGSILSMLSTLK